MELCRTESTHKSMHFLRRAAAGLRAFHCMAKSLCTEEMEVSRTVAFVEKRSSALLVEGASWSSAAARISVATCMQLGPQLVTFAVHQ